MGAVSFGSTFKITKLKDYSQFGDMVNFCDENNYNLRYKNEVREVKRNGFTRIENNMSNTIIAPDSQDKLIEAFLSNKGIKFKKLNTKELLKKSGVESRIEDAPKDMKLVKVDAQKLEDFIANQDTNIMYCKDNYEKYYKSNVRNILKSGDKISATTLMIYPTGETVDDAVNYIEKFGADCLNHNQLSVMFIQKTEEPDQCMYFGLKKLGMDKIPMYADKNSYKLGNALGLFE